MKAAVVGAGRIARQHLACLEELVGVTTVAVCDLSPVAAEAAAERFGVQRWFVDHAEMLAESRPDVVHVTTPPGSHLALASEALRAGAHVLVEKPIARDAAELDALLDVAHEAGRHVIEDQNYLFNRQTRRLIEMRDAGELGEVVHVEAAIALDISGFGDPNLPHPALSLPGGAISDFLTHLSSLAYAFVGAHRDVHTVWSKRDGDSTLAADDMRALVAAERGTATLSFSSAAAPDVFRLAVEGTRVRAEANLFETDLVLERVRSGPRPLQPVLNRLGVARDSARGAVGGLVRKLSGGPGSYEGLWELVRRTYEALDAGTEPPVSEEAIVAVNRLVAAIAEDAPAA